MPKLSFNQRMLVELYPQFYHVQYPDPSTLSSDALTCVHVNAQKMCYMLKKIGIDVGSYNYSWNLRGPFSPGLLSLLHSLDEHSDNVREYYETSNRSTFFSHDDQIKINLLIQALHLKDHKDDCSQWMELLGSIAFLSHSVFPGEDYEVVVSELMARKNQFCDSDANRAAWDALMAAGLLRVG